MGILRIFRFYEEAASYTAPDPSAVEQAGADGSRQVTYHRRIVLAAGVAVRQPPFAG